MHSRYVSDILKMCIKKFNAKNYFLTNLQGFDLHIAGGILLALLAANFLFLFCFNFNARFTMLHILQQSHIQ